MLTDVIALRVPHATGSLSKAMHAIMTEGINIEYMYAFSSNNRAKVVIRTNDIARCEELLLSIQD